jgi:hypothetical protein
MNALSLEVISNPILRATIRDIMERVYGIAPTPGQMELTNTFPGSEPNRNEATTSGLRSGELAQRPLEAAIPATGAGHITHAGSNPAAQSDERNTTGSGTRVLKLTRSDTISAEEAA